MYIGNSTASSAATVILGITSTTVLLRKLVSELTKLTEEVTKLIKRLHTLSEVLKRLYRPKNKSKAKIRVPRR